MPDCSDFSKTSITALTASQKIQEKLLRLGIRSEMDLVLHLPIRYEDETHLFPISHAPQGRVVQVEGIIVDNEVIMKPRRQLVCCVTDESGSLVMRFLNFMAVRSRRTQLENGYGYSARSDMVFSVRKWCIQNAVSYRKMSRLRLP